MHFRAREVFSAGVSGANCVFQTPITPENDAETDSRAQSAWVLHVGQYLGADESDVVEIGQVHHLKVCALYTGLGPCT